MRNTVNVNIKMEPELKKSMEEICAELGITLSAAITIFAKKVVREKRIPFELSIDPFYCQSNVRHLENILKDIREGKARFAEHDLIEAEE